MYVCKKSRLRRRKCRSTTKAPNNDMIKRPGEIKMFKDAFWLEIAYSVPNFYVFEINKGLNVETEYPDPQTTSLAQNTRGRDEETKMANYGNNVADCLFSQTAPARRRRIEI